MILTIIASLAFFTDVVIYNHFYYSFKIVNINNSNSVNNKKTIKNMSEHIFKELREIVDIRMVDHKSDEKAQISCFKYYCEWNSNYTQKKKRIMMNILLF